MTSGMALVTRSRRTKPTDSSPNPVAAATPNKTTRPTRKGKKTAVTNNQIKCEPSKSDDCGGVQTNEVDIVADDKHSTDGEEFSCGFHR